MKMNHKKRFIVHAIACSICVLLFYFLCIVYLVRITGEEPIAALSAEISAKYPPPQDAKYFIMSHGKPGYQNKSVFDRKIEVGAAIIAMLACMGYLLYVFLFMNLSSKGKKKEKSKYFPT